MKKIVHLTTVHTAQDIRIFFKECVSLKEAGYDVTLIAQADQNAAVNAIRILALPKTRSRLQRMTRLLWQIYRKALREQADLYHFHDPELLPVGILLRLHRKKVIYDVHEDVPNDILLKEWLPQSMRVPLGKVLGILEYLCAKFFNGIVTVTPHISQRFSHTNTVEVRNYPILKDFSDVPDFAERKNLCYAGLINQQRGLVAMIKAAEHTKTPLYLAGSLGGNIDQTIIESPFTTYCGYLDRQELNAIYAQSFVGLALLHPGPTFNQSLPIKIFEYMAAGVPIIASDFQIWRDIIETYQCGFCVDPFDSEQVNEKIIFLKTHLDVARQMGARGKAAVKQHFSWQTQADKLLFFYQQILHVARM